MSFLEDKELRKLLDEAVASLPEQRRMVFKLIKEDGLKTAAVAQILGISKRTAENQLYKAVKTLAETLSDYLGYHPQSKVARKQQLRDLSLLFL
jgi:RNA polymerase sigma-70 factor (ECF subfamily)